MSKLKRAMRLLEDPNARLEELADLVRDMRMILIEKSQTLDVKTKNQYAIAVSRLTKIVDAGRAEEKQATFERKQEKQHYLAKKGIQTHTKTFYDKQNSESNSEPKVQPILAPSNGEKKYLLPSFFPSNILQGQVIWLDYVGMQALRESKGRIIMQDKTELILTNKIPELWIGDLMVQSKSQINFYKKVLEVEPVINLERISKLHPFYQAPEYRPMVKGELFWTRTPPLRANRPQNSYGGEQKIMPSKVADYLVKIKGFVIFVSGVDANVLCNSGNIFDFVYTGDTYNKTSGRGTFVEDSIRKTVTENIQDYIALGKGQK